MSDFVKYFETYDEAEKFAKTFNGYHTVIVSFVWHLKKWRVVVF